MTIEGETTIGAGSQIVANGANAPHGNVNITCCGAGAGGTVILRSISLSGTGPIGASGGDGYVDDKLVRGGGGGGRVVLAIGKNNYGGKISAFGGSTGKGSNSGGSNPTPIVTPSCYAGGHGTIYNAGYKNIFSINTSVVQISGPSTGTITPQSTTPLSIVEKDNVYSLYVEYNGIVVGKDTLNLKLSDIKTLNAGIFVSSGGSIILNFGAETATRVQAETVSIGQHGVIDATGLGTESLTIQLTVGNGGLLINGNFILQGQVDVLSMGPVDIFGCFGTTCNGNYISSLYDKDKNANAMLHDFENHQLIHNVKADAQGYIFVNASGSVTVEENGLLFADKFIVVSDFSTISFGSKTPSAGGTQRGPCLAGITHRSQCADIVKSVWIEKKRPETNFTAVALTREGFIQIPGYLGADRLLLCTIGEASGVQISGKLSTLGNGCSGGYKTGQSPYPGGGGNCLQATTAGGGGGHGGHGGESSDKQAGGKSYGPSIGNRYQEHIFEVRTKPSSPSFWNDHGHDIVDTNTNSNENDHNHDNNNIIAVKKKASNHNYIENDLPTLDTGEEEDDVMRGGDAIFVEKYVQRQLKHKARGKQHSHKQAGGYGIVNSTRYDPYHFSISRYYNPIVIHELQENGVYIDMEDEPLLSGAGGGCSGGGAGGGLITIDTSTFTILLGGIVVADGLDGMASTGVNEGGNGGGGAGGSITIIASYFYGSGRLSANGGDGFCSTTTKGSVILANKTYGGGGGGGRLNVEWKLGDSSFVLHSNRDWTENFTGNLSFNGGYPNGNYGNLATPKCPAGTYLYLYRASGGVPECLGCPPGKYNDNNIDDINDRETSICHKCPTGSYANGTGNTVCTVCAAGSTCDTKGCGYCPLCPVGQYSSSNTTCNSCENKPMNSRYSHAGEFSRSCKYNCSAGYVGVGCITPLARVINALGGLASAIAILSGSLLAVVAISYLSCSYIPGCPGYKLDRFDIRKFRGLRRLPTGSIGSDTSENISSGYTTPNYMSPMLQPQTFDSPMIGLENGSRQRNYAVRGMSEQKQHEITLTLMERDLGYHVFRLYAKGNNTPSNSWKFPEKIPNELQPIIDAGRYNKFAHGLNESMKWNETCCESFWRVFGLTFFYPCCKKLVRKRRKRTIVNARHYVFNYDHAMMRGHKAKALMNCIKLGSDIGHSTCFMDLLYVEVSPIPPPLQLGKPELPLALLFTGDGTWKNPYRLDLDDTLVASVPNLGMLSKFIDQSWLKFLCDLNSTLRTIRPDDLEGSLGKTLKMLHDFNPDDLGGLRVRLAKFHPSGTTRLGIMLDLNPLENTTTSFNLTGSIGGRNMNIKMKDQYEESKHGNMSDFNRSNGNGSTTPVKIRRNSNGNGKPPLSPSSTNGGSSSSSTGKYRRKRSIREQMLSDDAIIDKIGEENNMSNGTIVGIGNSRESNNYDKTTSFGFNKSGVYGDNNNSKSPMSKQAFSNGMSNMIDDNEYKRRKSEEELEKELLYNGDPWIYDGQPIDMKGSNIRLRNDFVCFQMWRALPARSKFARAWIKRSLIILLLCDAIVTSYLLLNYFCIQVNDASDPDNGCTRIGFAGFLLLYPAACVVSPCIGLTAIVFDLSRLSRDFAEWNMLSTINAICGFGIFYIYHENLDLSSLVCPFILLILKFLQAFLNAKNLAHLENGHLLDLTKQRYVSPLGLDFSSPPNGDIIDNKEQSLLDTNRASPLTI